MEVDDSMSDISFSPSFKDLAVFSEETGDYEYDYSDPYHNYERIEQTLKDLTEGEILTEEWMEEHKRHIEKYAEVIPQFRLSEQMSDERYQKLVEQLEWNLDQVVDGILRYDKIELNLYEDYIRTFIKVHQLVSEMNDICDMFGNM